MSAPFRVLFTCSRTYQDQTTVFEVLDILAKHAAAEGFAELVVVHGACFRYNPPASDLLAELWIRRGDHPLPVGAERHPALYAQHGKRATWVRNAEMVRSGIDVCLSFEMPGSKGARGTADLAEKEEVTVRRFGPEYQDGAA